jgi:hypothetical protein
VAFGATPAFARVPHPSQLGAPAAPASAAPPSHPSIPSIPAKHPSISAVHTVVIGGMPGWQITLIAAGAALLAAAIAVLADRARAAHRKAITAA